MTRASPHHHSMSEDYQVGRDRCEEALGHGGHWATVIV
jgi:hypothetical protein